MHGSAAPISIDLTAPPSRGAVIAPASAISDLGTIPPAFQVPSAQLSAEVLEHQVGQMQQQMDELRTELNDLRRRDETLNFYLHRMDEELRLAARLQQDFLPKEMPRVGPLQFHSLFRPAGYVSGDLYDVMRLDDKHVGFYMADAVGHGVPAALLAMFLKHALQTRDRDGSILDPTETLRRLNMLVIEQGLSQSTFATALYGIINTETLELRMSRAGHPCPILMRADGTVQELASHGCLLGVFAEETFDGYTTKLTAGDRLLVYTDGIEVAFWDDQHSQESQELHRWHRELLARRHMDAQQLLTEFGEHIDNDAGSLSARDDLTMLLIDVAK
jgi:sigma-B regulation protein RsbU (phosphoserine phosphatase)